MRKLAVATAVGIALLAAKLALLFHVFAFPLLLDAFGALLFVVALVALAVQAIRRKPLMGRTALVLALGLAALDLPVAKLMADARVRDAQEYCAALSVCADFGCPDLADWDEKSFPQLPGRPLPTLLQPGYSVRYKPNFHHDVFGSACTFPGPFPGRSYSSGERPPDGTWTWEILQD